MTRNSSEVLESRKNFSTSLKEGTSPKKLKKKKARVTGKNSLFNNTTESCSPR
jgi:hypothetical protein